MDFSIRLASDADAPQIAELLKGILKLHASGRPDIFRSCGAKYGVSEVSEMIKDPSKKLWVAVNKDTVLGYLISIIQTHSGSVMAQRTCLWIDDLYIREENRHDGIGRALIDTAVEFAKSSDYTAVELNVWSFNENAVKFYEKQGFTPQRTVMELPLKNNLQPSEK